MKAKTILRKVFKKTKQNTASFTYCARPCHFFQHLHKAEEKSWTETAATYSVDDVSGVDVLQREENRGGENEQVKKKD